MLDAAVWATILWLVVAVVGGIIGFYLPTIIGLFAVEEFGGVVPGALVGIVLGLSVFVFSIAHSIESFLTTLHILFNEEVVIT